MIYDDAYLWIEWHESEIPWIKIFGKSRAKELTLAPEAEQEALWRAVRITEKAMLAYYRPDKINIASFGNYLPELHWHVMARFVNDSHFPEPMWGCKQRESTLQLPDQDGFERLLRQMLAEH
ncbi:MAG: HIT family protein [Campylobacterales bacterium]